MKQFIVFGRPDSKGIIRLKNGDYNYLAAVRRMREGQTIDVSIEGKTPARAEVLKINTEKRYIELKISAEYEKSAPLSAMSGAPCIILMQWLIKGPRMDTAVRQAAEAGVRSIFPVLGEFSVIKTENKNQTERRRRIIREARQQSGSPTATEIFAAQAPEDALKSVSAYTEGKKTVFLMLTEKNEASNGLFYYLADRPEAVVLAVGAEGGISTAESGLLKQYGFCPVHLKTNVWRAETAAVYSIAAVQTLLTEGETWRLNG